MKILIDASTSTTLRFERAHALALTNDLTVEQCRERVAAAERERDELLRAHDARSMAEAMCREAAAKRTSPPSIYTDAHRVRDYLESVRYPCACGARAVPGNVMAAAARLAQQEDRRYDPTF